MAKLWTYVFITIGLMVLFYVAGLTGSEGVVLGSAGYNMTSMERVADIKGTDFFDYIKTNGWFALAGIAGAVIIGTLLKASPYVYLSAGIATGILAKFVGDLVIVGIKLNESGGWIGWLALLILAPLVFGYVLALWEWVGGRD